MKAAIRYFDRLAELLRTVAQATRSGRWPAGWDAQAAARVRCWLVRRIFCELSKLPPAPPESDDWQERVNLVACTQAVRDQIGRLLDAAPVSSCCNH